MKAITFLNWFVFVLSATSFGQCERARVVKDYQERYLGSQLSNYEMAWSGTNAGNDCREGTISKLAHEKTLMRINYFRELVGLPGDIVFKEELNQKCQKAAFMMRKNGKLSHNPTEDWICYSKDGDMAAKNSNLSTTYGPDAITAYISDYGANNTSVGHRRLILNSRASVFGHGSVPGANALWVVGNFKNAPENWEFTAYPAPGLFPAPLVFPRWSFSARANFEEATVEMKRADGSVIPLKIVSKKDFYADPTIVWEPEITYEERNSPSEFVCRVEIKNAKLYSGVVRDFHYQVTIIPVVYPPVCADGTIWQEEACSCVPENTVAKQKFTEVKYAKVYPNPFSDFLIIEKLNMEDTDRLRIKIFSAEGRHLLTRTCISKDLRIPTPQLKQGDFYVHIWKDGLPVQVERVFRKVGN